MMEHLSIEIKARSSPGKINFVKDIVNTQDETYVTVKFSARKSGEYRIQVLSGAQQVSGSPFSKTFLPGDLDVEKTEFLRPSPTVLCTTFEDKLLHIRPKDKFENICHVTEKEVAGFQFTADWVGLNFDVQSR
jgi:hypothetical protein